MNSYHTLRGGSWYSSLKRLYSSSRGRSTRNFNNFNTSFRLVRTKP